MPGGEQIAKPAERASRLAGSCFLGSCQEAICDSLHAVRRASPSACFSPAVANPTSPSPQRVMHRSSVKPRRTAGQARSTRTEEHTAEIHSRLQLLFRPLL